MKTLYESILDDDDIAINKVNDHALIAVIDDMLNSGVKDKKLINLLKKKIAIYPVNDDNIKDVIKKYIKLAGNNCSLNWIDTSKVTDMYSLFEYSGFNGDISKWDVSNVETMAAMFAESSFNGDISKWDVSNVKYMGYMFHNCENFNQPLNNWDISKVKDMSYMFYKSIFNRDISKWNVFNVKKMDYMFAHSSFNQNISNWDISTISHIDIFRDCLIEDKFLPKLTKYS